MTEAPTYRFRLSRFRRETTYRLTEQALAWSDGETDGALPFADIRQMRIYDSPGVNSYGVEQMPAFTRCTIKPNAGRALILSSNHFGGLADWQSRIDSFRPFMDALIRRAALANPNITFLDGMPMAMWITWIVILIGLLIVTPFGLIVLVVTAIEGQVMSAGFFTSLAICLGLVLGIIPIWGIVKRNRPRPFDGRAGRPAE